MTVHKYGLGETTRNILLSEADIKGQGTFAMKDEEADAGTEWSTSMSRIAPRNCFASNLVP